MMPKSVFVFLLLGLTGCTQLAYYEQAISGHWRVMEARQPVDRLLAEADLEPPLRERLATALAIRDYASRELALPDNTSYTRYVALDRPYVVYNVLAAPELSLEPYSWCYLVIGCASYRGYFDPAAAEREAVRLREQGLDVFVAGIPAYSTLGWFADPLLSSFIHWPEGLLAELIFHELAHQRLYVRDDTPFNESFATAVGERGAARWLRDHPEALAEYRRLQAYLEDFRRLLAEGRAQLAAVYAGDQPAAEQRGAKQRILDELLADYQELKQDRWGGFNGYDPWVGEGFNNAKLAVLQTYTVHQPAFENLLDLHDGDFAAFYKAVEALAALPPEERERRLAELSAG